MLEKNFFEALQHQYEVNPHGICVQDATGTYSYSEIFEKAIELSKHLSSVPKGHIIALLTPNNHTFIVGLFAIIKNNNVALPIDYHNQAANVKEILTESKAKFVLSTTSLGGDFKTIDQEEAFILHAMDKASESVFEYFPSAAFIRYTSGTTGKAKGVVISHGAVYSRTKSAQQTLSFQSGKNMLWLLPMAYHFVVSLCLYVRYGISIVTHEGFLAEDLLETIQKHDIQYIYGSPLHVKTLSKFSPTAHPLQMIISTTAGLDLKDANRFQTNFNIPVTQAFGIIEVGLPLINMSDAHHHPEAVGQKSQGHEVVVLDEAGSVLPKNEIGLLAIKKNSSMFSGYLSPVIKLDEVLQNNFFYTGDLSYYDEQETFYIKGRQKNVILVAGNKVFPEEVELKINSLTSIEESKVYGKKHQLFGHTICVDVVVKDKITIEKIRQEIQAVLPQQQWPHEIHLVDEIKRTKTGKIKRH